MAALLAASPTVAQPAQNNDARVIVLPRPSPFTPDVAAACGGLANLTVAPDGVPLRKLNELPLGVLEHAVWRSVKGCPMREVVYKGQLYYVGPSIPKLETGPAVDNRARRYTV